jgi:hypothetical protein
LSSIWFRDNYGIKARPFALAQEKMEGVDDSLLCLRFMAGLERGFVWGRSPEMKAFV